MPFYTDLSHSQEAEGGTFSFDDDVLRYEFAVLTRGVTLEDGGIAVIVQIGDTAIPVVHYSEQGVVLVNYADLSALQDDLQDVLKEYEQVPGGINPDNPCRRLGVTRPVKEFTIG